MNTYSSYKTLIKPRWAPPAWLFGPVWTILYVFIAISFGFVGYFFYSGQIDIWILVPFILNLVFNFAFTPIQFGLKNNILAAIDVLLVLATLIWLMISIYPFAPWVAYINIPYLAWVTFATILQLTITYLNA